LGAIVEQHYDKDGIIWPMSVAPYHVIITLVNPEDSVQREAGEKMYQTFLAENIDVLLDDRQERPGVKFKDADLLGIPIRITVGRGAASGLVEFKRRCEEENQELSFEEATKQTIEIVRRERDGV